MKNLSRKWFTLVEILVALTIFSLIMVSVMSVFIISSDTTYNSEINRWLQENVKNVILDISEEIMANGIYWVGYSLGISWDCKWDNLWKWKIFCSKENTEYYLVDWKSWGIANEENCLKIDSECYLVKAIDRKPYKLTNNLVTVRKLNFIYKTDWKVKRVTILAEIQPSLKAWIKSSAAKRNIYHLQTTFTERFWNNN